ncbi:MAG: SDR family NAD(P)-dependent oxidoreductase [Hydrococcus sp. CRU_1_1]|nr:SDR family NAD(P)-dependent oxidoreductase [Hydrococcus sp. CRU_1_1]
MTSINTTINSSSVVLVSGGGRGVTAQCAIQLAKQYQCNLILLGRSSLTNVEPEWAKNCFQESELKKRIMEALIALKEKPTPLKVQSIFKNISQSREIDSTLSTIRNLGGTAEYLSVDLTNFSALQTAINSVVQRLGKVTGIIHGAGNLADKLIEDKSEQDFEKVYSAKVEGLENLLDCIGIEQLRFASFFSSFVAFYGNKGQSDYSLANDILNKFAYLLQRKNSTCHVVSIGWGPWDGGMVSPHLKKKFTESKIDLIPLEVGSQFLIDELNNNYQRLPQIIVMSRPIISESKHFFSKNQTFRIYRKLTLEANPFVLDHVIGHRPVLPAMCALSWLINSCEQLYPGYRFFSCENYKVLKGIVFDETLAKSYTLDLHESDTSIPNEINFEAILWSESSKKIPQYHYSSKIKLLAKIPQVLSEINPSDRLLKQEQISLSPYENGTLFHRGNFQGIKRIISLDSEGAIAECYVKSSEQKQQGQFPIQTFNPYTSDMLFQCLLVWVRHFYDFGSLPLQVNQIKQFKTIPFDRIFYVSLTIQSKNDNQAIAKALVFDESGEIYLEIDRMQVTISSRLNSLFLENDYFSRTIF